MRNSTKKRYQEIRERHAQLKAATTKSGGRKHTTDQIFEILHDEFYYERSTLENIVYYQTQSA